MKVTWREKQSERVIVHARYVTAGPRGNRYRKGVGRKRVVEIRWSGTLQPGGLAVELEGGNRSYTCNIELPDPDDRTVTGFEMHVAQGYGSTAAKALHSALRDLRSEAAFDLKELERRCRVLRTVLAAGNKARRPRAKGRRPKRR